jgi:hypothetical protein
MSNTTEWIGALATATAAVVAGVYTVLTYKLLKITASGVAVAQKTFSSSHRPYVGISDVKLTKNRGFDAALLIGLQNYGTVPALDMSLEVRVRIGDQTFAEERAKRNTTLFPQVLDHHFAIPLSGDKLRPFLTDLQEAEAIGRMDIEIRVSYAGLADVRFETICFYHKNSQDTHFLQDRVLCN